MSTTGKVEIPEGAMKEVEFLYLHNIVTIVKKYEIPQRWIWSSLKVHTCNESRYGKTNSKSVSIAGSSYKRSITGTFIIPLNGHFLPMQLIYGGKQSKASLGLRFPMVYG